MSLTNFPHGITSFGVPVIGSGPIVTTGNVFFVDDSGSNGNPGTSPSQPFSTLTYAISRCTASQGDVIVLMPGHAETISTTVTCSTAGISIIGLGNGANRPNLTQGTTGSTGMLTIAADSVRIANVMFTGSATGTNEPLITLTTASHVLIEGCYFAPASKQLYTINLDGTAETDITIRNCQFVATAAGPDAIIFGNKMVHRVTIEGCTFNTEASSGCDHGVITVSSSNSLGWLIKDCIFYGNADGEEVIKPLSGSTGFVMNCRAYVADSTDVILPSNIFGVVELYATEAGKNGSKVDIRPVATPAA